MGLKVEAAGAGNGHWATARQAVRCPDTNDM